MEKKTREDFTTLILASEKTLGKYSWLQINYKWYFLSQEYRCCEQPVGDF